MNVFEKILNEKEIAAIKELIEENKKCFNQCEGACCSVENGICNCEDGAIVQAIYKMKNCLEKQNDETGGWIPVEKRLPKEPKYLEDSYIVQQDCVTEPFSAWWDGKRWTDINDDTIEGIVAWQPLPTRYIPSVISKQAQDLRDRESFFMEER